VSWRGGRKWGPRKRGELKNEKLTAAAAVPVTVLSAVVVLSDVAGLLLAAAAAATAAVSPVAVSAATTTPASSVSTASAVAAAASTLGAGEGKSWIFVRGVGFGKEKGEEEQEVEFLVFRIDARDLEKKKSLRLKNEKIFHSPLEQHNSARTARAAERLYILRPAGVKETEKEREREREREEKRREEESEKRRGRSDRQLPPQRCPQSPVVGQLGEIHESRRIAFETPFRCTFKRDSNALDICIPLSSNPSREKVGSRGAKAPVAMRRR